MTQNKNQELGFFIFLKKHKAYARFIENYRRVGIHTKTPYEWVLTSKPLYVLLGAFEWEKTKEGQSYWGDLQDKWVIELYGEEDIPETNGKKR